MNIFASFQFCKLCLLFSLLWFAGSLFAQQGYVCSNNDYALCSHANCECLDKNGDVGPCQPYDFLNPGSSIGWARCTCPIVKHNNEFSPYNSNFATLDCATLANPQTSENGNPFPDYDYLKEKKVQVYSTYSFGDSLNNDQFGTLDDASLMICDDPKIMTLCLDMPCTVGENGDVAECYCQNTRTKPADQCLLNHTCKLTVWNTLGGQCDQGNCNPGAGRVWSAAYVPQTVQGIIDLYQDITSKDPAFTDRAEYCLKP